MSKAEKWRVRGANGKALGTQGWEADRERSNCCIYTGLWKGKKVAALLVAHGAYDEIKEEIDANANEILTALNSHEMLLDALRSAEVAIETSDDREPQMIAALSAIQSAIAKATGQAGSTPA